MLIYALDTGYVDNDGKSVYFHMRDYITSTDNAMGETDDIFEPSHCNTAACIAGHLMLLYPERYRGSYFNLTMELLDIDKSEAIALITPQHLELAYITRQEAIKVLRNLKETGEVHWEESGKAWEYKNLE